MKEFDISPYSNWDPNIFITFRNGARFLKLEPGNILAKTHLLQEKSASKGFKVQFFLLCTRVDEQRRWYKKNEKVSKVL